MVKLSRFFLVFIPRSFLRLSELYANNNLYYSAMNTAMFALSLVIFPLEGCTFGIHPLVCRLLKGIFTKRPSSPRYHCVWDVVIVLKTKYLKTLHPIRGLHLRDLTLKITMLIALLSGQRCQTIHALDISDMQVVCLQFSVILDYKREIDTQTPDLGINFPFVI